MCCFEVGHSEHHTVFVRGQPRPKRGKTWLKLCGRQPRCVCKSFVADRGTFKDIGNPFKEALQVCVQKDPPKNTKESCVCMKRRSQFLVKVVCLALLLWSTDFLTSLLSPDCIVFAPSTKEWGQQHPNEKMLTCHCVWSIDWMIVVFCFVPSSAHGLPWAFKFKKNEEGHREHAKGKRSLKRNKTDKRCFFTAESPNNKGRIKQRLP